MLRNLLAEVRKNRATTLRVISVFFLLSIFSILMSFNNEIFYLFFNRFSSIIKQFLNKKAMFCFFNAILLFVVKDSGMLASSIELPAAARRPVQNFAENSPLSQMKNITVEENLQIAPTKKITVEESQQLSLTKQIQVEATKVEKMKPALMEGNDSLEEEEDNEEVDGEMEELGREELNKKCEEFINRVKKQIKRETLQEILD